MTQPSPDDSPVPLRSAAWFDSPDLYGWTRKAALLGQGLNRESFAGKPVIGIANSWSELTHCNAHLRSLAEAVYQQASAQAAAQTSGNGAASEDEVVEDADYEVIDEEATKS